MKIVAGILIIALSAALIAMVMLSAQAANTSVQANLAQGIANTVANGAVLQAQCLAGLVGVLGLAAGIPLEIFIYSRHQHRQQEKLALVQMRIRAQRQPRRSNGQFSHGKGQPGVQLPAGYLPQGAQPYVLLLPNQLMQLPQAPVQRGPNEMIVIEDDPADYLDQWGDFRRRA